MLHISSCKSVILANLSIIVFCVACFSFIFLFLHENILQSTCWVPPLAGGIFFFFNDAHISMPYPFFSFFLCFCGSILWKLLFGCYCASIEHSPSYEAWVNQTLKFVVCWNSTERLEERRELLPTGIC